MNNNLGFLAPPPEHGKIEDPLWLKLWDTYEPVITALRRIPLTTNVEISGGEFGITATLIDGSHLWISSLADLPLNPSQLEGWHVRRAHEDTPTVDELVYDSTEDGEQSQHGNNIAALIQAIATFVTERHLAPRLIDLTSVRIDGVTKRHRPISQLIEGPFPDRRQAISEYHCAVHDLMERDWRCVHKQGGAEWPLTIWELDGEVITVYVAHVGQAIV
ncbi:hypothetical protein SRB5_15950 [Streptomyces sp. RB5]|uniref:Uncharacterized protein n=1 Tax=Streptomyces smaragdinus TaxID=2585196 RepID=A0A7K0CDL9_9ACTN|nr:hypothetical protein [Streptomyces smaragdinus]MQY11476.1 hypothetical protein [Streptomyces smaragdinus]